MGDEKDSWKVKTLDEILQEKKRRRELKEKTDLKHSKNVSTSFNLKSPVLNIFMRRIKLC